MDLAEECKKQYGWQHAQMVEENILKTDHGLKRVRHWNDQDLLNWHINWRDHCTRAPIVLIDRMIRTTDGEAYLSHQGHWLTVHDEVTERFSYTESGQVWGMLLGLMITYGLQAEIDLKRTKRKAPDLFILEKKIWRFPEAVQSTLRMMVHEGKRRLKKAEAIQNKAAADEKLPLLDPFKLEGQARSVHGMLHWTGGSDYPEEGYASVSQWLKKRGLQVDQEGLETALDQVTDVYPSFPQHQAQFLLAECLIPYELEAMSQMDPQKETDESLNQLLLQSKKEWNESQQIVLGIADWLDRRNQSK